jgi:hypothetical protein
MNERWWDNMTQRRHNELMLSMDVKLTEDEMKYGWHFCYEFDGLVTNAHDPEMRNCGCRCMEEHPGFKYGVKPT